jgi:hypothetical protein
MNNSYKDYSYLLQDRIYLLSNEMEELDYDL